MGIAEANAQFIVFELGSPGSQSNGGTLKTGYLFHICSSSFFPPLCKLGERIIDIPYFLLGDDAFALDTHLMKPYPHRNAVGNEKVYNHRHSRARRIIENAFGILCARFRILMRPLELDVANAMEVVRACIALHNFLISSNNKIYVPPGFMDTQDSDGNVTTGSWINLVNDPGNVCDLRGYRGGRPSSILAREVRDTLKEYLYDEGAKRFQWSMTDL